MSERLKKVLIALEKEVGLEDYVSKDEIKKVYDCDYQSIVDSIATAKKLDIPIDKRGFVYLDGRYDKNLGKKICTLGIEYKAYFYKLSHTLENFDGEAFCIYEGDEITTKDKDGFHSYTLIKGNVFSSGQENIKGVVVRLSYTIGGSPRQKLGFVGISELNKIRGKAKYKNVWNEWFDEKAKAAATRRACKGLFDIAIGIQDLVEQDNKSFDLENDNEKSVVETIDEVDEKQIKDWFGVKSLEDIDKQELKEHLEDHT